jgi:hypothetical protein
LSDLSQRRKDALADRYRIERELGRGGMATVFLILRALCRPARRETAKARRGA